MKSNTITCFAALMLLAVSCKKENSTLQSSVITNESLTQALSSEANELAGVHAVRIGTQVWKIRNLNVSRYRNGDRIQQVQDAGQWRRLTTGAWCWYNNDSANCAVYGKLYNWHAVNDPRGLAPEGWHIPSDAEWDTLTERLGGYLVAGGKMKSTGTIEAGTGLWYAPNYGATNSSGFTGLPGGLRGYVGSFFYVGYGGVWWSSSENSTTNAWDHYLYYNDDFVLRFSNIKHYGYSVRCLRD